VKSVVQIQRQGKGKDLRASEAASGLPAEDVSACGDSKATAICALLRAALHTEIGRTEKSKGVAVA
jgi:phosphoserine phosphatase